MINDKFEKIEINKEWIEKNIEKPGWQRNIYPARVNYFLNKIKNKKFCSSLITLAKDKNNKKYILLDGQHKIEAIRLSKKSFVMQVLIYKDLNIEQMIEIYQMLNEVKAQRVIDDIKIHIGRNEHLDYFLNKNNFPINISLNGGGNSIRIDRFLSIISNGMKPFLGRTGLSRAKIHKFITNLDFNHVSIAKDFCEFYKKCFGEPLKENWVYSTIVMGTMMKIWLKNKDKFKEDELIKSFRKIENNIFIKQTSGRNDVMGYDELTRQIYFTINKNKYVKKFDKFWDENEPYEVIKNRKIQKSHQ